MAKVLDEARSERRDVGRFMAEHEACASDFEVGRVAGSSAGRLRLVCRGCGERAVYDVGGPDGLELVDRPQLQARERRRMTRAEIERWLPAPAALPWWIPNAYVTVLILAGVALIAAGLVARDDGDPIFLGGGGPQATSEAGSEPAPASPLAAPPAAAGEGEEGKGRSGKDRDSKPQNRPELDTVTVLGRFVIGVPPGWLRGLSDGAVVFRTPSREAQLRVFLEPGDEGPKTLSRYAADFLEGEHPSARISRPERFRLGGAPAVRVIASWEGGVERAALVSESGYSYLLLSRVDEEASGPTRDEADAALNSFNPL